MSRLRFLSLEGGEGCGKSTQIAFLVDALEKAGQKVLTLREPGGTALGEAIRHLLLKKDSAGAGMSAESELLLFAASRAELVRKSIRPALEQGTWVICDRFLDSTTVYQGIARGLNRPAVDAINGFAVGDTLPGLTLVLDLPATESLRRMSARPGGADRMESESVAFHEKVATGFRDLAVAHPERIRLIPAGGTREEVFTLLKKEFSHAFPGILD